MHLIAHYIKPSLNKVVGGMVFKLLGTVIELFIPYILAHIIDNITPLGNVRLVVLWGVGMLLCSALAWLGNIIANRNASAVARDTTRQLRHDLFAKIMYLSNRQVDTFTVPSLISRMTTDTYNIHRMIGMMQRIGVRAPILLIGGIIVTLTLDPVLAGILAAMIPLMIAAVYMISKKSLPMFSRVQRSMDALVRVVRENAAGVRIIKALSKSEYERQRFTKVNAEVVKNENRANMTMGLSRPILNLVFNLGLVLVIVVGAGRVDAGLTEVGKIIAFMTYFTIMLNAVLGVSRVLTMYSSALASAARIEEIMLSQGELERRNIPRQESGAHIAFQNVTFSYNKSQPNLENVSFALNRGESLGIIGPTGAGKSTVAALMMRFYDVGSGAILLEGQDIRGMDLAELRSRFGVVFQNDAVFKNTIEENIRIGRRIDLEQIEQAAQVAQAADYIKEAGGYGHPVDAHGVNLSGGQKQRLLISRALAGQPDILILDDSSSALDYRTDALLRQGIASRFSHTTTVIIAQRISSIKHCDKILVLEEGRVMGYGTHEELLAQNELYQEIGRLQMGEVEKSAS